MHILKRFLALIILLSYIGCNTNSASKRQVLPDEIRTCVKDSFLVQENDLHIGTVEITEGKAVLQGSDEYTRQKPRILLYDLLNHKDYGTFPWPDSQGSFYFGIAPYKESLLYFSNNQYFRKVDVNSKKVDTIPIKGEISELVKMVVINDKVYSLDNIYGIDIVDLKNTNHQIFKKNYRGSYYNEQNNISIPVQNDINLVASNEIAENQYSIYAVDTAMNIQWQKTIALKDPFVQISLLNVGDGFLLKYDNRLHFLNKADGKEKWRKEFDKHVYSLLPIDNSNVLLILSENNNGNRPLSGLPIKVDMISFNIATQKENWSINSISLADSWTFILNNCMFINNGGNNWQKVILSNGKFSSFKLEINRLSVMRDKKTGGNFLRFGNVFYW